MNEKTLKHLNKLEKLSHPILLSPEFSVDPSDQARKLWPALTDVARNYEPEMVRQEIIRAAQTRQQADSCNPSWPYCYATDARYSAIPWAATKRQWELARAELDAVIAADNAQRLAAYEAYRVACEQGVAVPPQD